MKQKIKKVFENAIWWSGVVMAGLILGISLQFVRAWTEPTTAPPNGNVGAPINTSDVTQNKSGLLGVLGLLTTYLNVPGDTPSVGDVLTAQESFPGSGVSDGKVAWVPGGGGGEKPCPPGFTNVKANGNQLGCMQTDQEGIKNSWYDAANTCFTKYGGRLPIFAEWYVAMKNYTFSGTTILEWLGNSDYYYKDVSEGACALGQFSGASPSFSNPNVAGCGQTSTPAHGSGDFGFRCWIPG